MQAPTTLPRGRADDLDWLACALFSACSLLGTLWWGRDILQAWWPV